MRFVSLLIVLGLGVVLACQTNKPKKGSDQNKRGAESALTYESHFKDWFDDKCNDCHGKDGSAEPELVTYEDIKAHKKKILVEVGKRRMPPKEVRKLKKQEFLDLKEWIENGMPRGSADDDDWLGDDDDWDTGGDDEGDDELQKPQLVAWDTGMEELIKTRCLSCHNGGPGSSYPNLSTYDLAAVAGPSMAAQVAADKMPPGGGLSAEDKAKFQNWLDQGMPRTAADAGGGGSGAVTYDGQMRAWIDRNCGPCHTTGTNLPNLNTKAAASASASAMLDSVEKGRMPIGKTVSGTDLQMLRDWVKAGAP